MSCFVLGDVDSSRAAVFIVQNECFYMMLMNNFPHGDPISKNKVQMDLLIERFFSILIDFVIQSNFYIDLQGGIFILQVGKK